MSEDLMIKIDNVKKQYRLGAIGGGTLQGDLQSWWARKHGKEDPNSKIGAKIYAKNEKFMALDGVSFEVKKGERVGIIGHNGAGKSTLLKLLSRVTAPTSGEIGLNGRVTSMLEVGTGFHGELTGRENIYMNGAILGMSKAEIDAKMEDIIEFSECRKFIDTPVKRYSSGMFVKLAFSVAAHLDSEIMIMDEVLAVGDMAFQKKCLDKMNDVSKTQGRTILYVSHNMNTIFQLCNRCIVLEHGTVAFDGDVYKGVDLYCGIKGENECYREYLPIVQSSQLDYGAKILSAEYFENKSNIFIIGQNIKIKYKIKSLKDIGNFGIRLEVLNEFHNPVASFLSDDIYSGENGTIIETLIEYDISNLIEGKYHAFYVLFNKDQQGNCEDIDCVQGLPFEIADISHNVKIALKWDKQHWGSVCLKNQNIIYTNRYLE